jgi:hypothetical protein
VLADLSPTPVKIKIDTGARTSALHAFGMRVEDRNGIKVATFELHPVQRSREDAVEVSCPVTSFRKVRSSNGRVETRPVVQTTVQLGPTVWPIEVTLTSRDTMGFRMLLGRAAIRRRFLVDPGRSFVLTKELSP